MFSLSCAIAVLSPVVRTRTERTCSCPPPSPVILTHISPATRTSVHPPPIWETFSIQPTDIKYSSSCDRASSRNDKLCFTSYWSLYISTFSQNLLFSSFLCQRKHLYKYAIKCRKWFSLMNSTLSAPTVIEVPSPLLNGKIVIVIDLCCPRPWTWSPQ